MNKITWEWFVLVVILASFYYGLRQLPPRRSKLENNLASYTPVRSPSPIPSPIDYSQDFSIILPSGWRMTNMTNPVQYSNYSEEVGLKPPDFVKGRDDGKLKIEIYINESSEPLEKWYAKYKENSLESEISARNIMVGGETALFVEGESYVGRSTSVFVKNTESNRIYQIVFALDFASYPQIRDQILSSFRFTK